MINFLQDFNENMQLGGGKGFSHKNINKSCIAYFKIKFKGISTTSSCHRWPVYLQASPHWLQWRLTDTRHFNGVEMLFQIFKKTANYL